MKVPPYCPSCKRIPNIGDASCTECGHKFTAPCFEASNFAATSAAIGPILSKPFIPEIYRAYCGYCQKEVKALERMESVSRGGALIDIPGPGAVFFPATSTNRIHICPECGSKVFTKKDTEDLLRQDGGMKGAIIGAIIGILIIGVCITYFF